MGRRTGQSRGKPPLPVAMHRLKGTFEPGRMAHREANEPEAVGEVSPIPPDFLSEAGKRVWSATLPFLMRGVVGAADYQALAAWCNQCAVHNQAVEAQRQLDEGKALPFLTKGKGGVPAVSPYIRIARQAAMTAAILGSNLGLSPVARARIGALAFSPDAPPVAAAEDPWSGFNVIEGGRKRR